MTILRIIATDPEDLIAKVNQTLADKYDIYTSPFVSFEGLLVQRMTPSVGGYEYQLINADNLDDLKTAEENLIELGYDYMFNTIMWYGRYLQWMGRMTDSGLMVRDAVMLNLPNAAEIFFQNAEREDELKLVEGVRAALRLEPTADKLGCVVTLPFPLSS